MKQVLEVDRLSIELKYQASDKTVMVFLSFLSSSYRLTISPSTYGYNVTCSPM